MVKILFLFTNLKNVLNNLEFFTNKPVMWTLCTLQLVSHFCCAQMSWLLSSDVRNEKPLLAEGFRTLEISKPGSVFK